MSAIFRFAFLLFFACLSLSSTAFAQIDAQKGAELKQALRAMLDRYVSDVEHGGTQLMEDGEIMVEENDYYYAVTLPDLTVKSSDGTYTRFGMMSINAMPGDEDGQWKMTLAAPSPIIMYMADGTPAMQVELGEQNVAAIWQSDLNGNKGGFFTKMKLHYQDVAISMINPMMPAMGMKATIPDLRYVMDLKKNEQGLWSGPSHFTAQNMAMEVTPGMMNMQLGELSVVMNLHEYSFEALEQYEDVMSAIGAEDGHINTEGASYEHVVGLYNTLIKGVADIMDGFDMGVKVENFAMNVHDENGEQRIALDTAGIGLGMKGFRSGKVGMNIGAHFNGVSMTPRNEQIGSFAPKNLNIDLALNELPFDEIVKVGGQSLEMALAQPEMGNMVGLQALMSMPQLLTTAGTNLEITDTHMGNDEYHVSLGGQLTADMSSVNGAVGKIRLAIRGLDRMLELAQKRISDPDIDDATKEQLKQTIAGSSLVLMMGKEEIDENGENIRVYNLESTKEGKMLLNGIDASALMGLQKGQGKKADTKSTDEAKDN
jgi:hypothetical protein